MKIVVNVLIGQLVFAAAIVAAEPDDTLCADYHALFEQGRYHEAISCIENRAHVNGEFLTDQLVYLAFCRIMIAEPDQADSLFMLLLDRDSTFALDPIMTSPKMYEVFAQSVQNWEKKRLENTAPPSQPDESVIADSSYQEPSALLVRPVPIALCLLPMGGGYFAHQRPLPALLVAAAQAGVLVASVVLFNTRDNHLHPEYGLYRDNLAAYRRSTYGYRIGFSAALGLWSASSIHSLVMRRNTFESPDRGPVQ